MGNNQDEESGARQKPVTQAVVLAQEFGSSFHRSRVDTGARDTSTEAFAAAHCNQTLSCGSAGLLRQQSLARAIPIEASTQPSDLIDKTQMHRGSTCDASNMGLLQPFQMPPKDQASDKRPNDERKAESNQTLRYGPAPTNEPRASTAASGTGRGVGTRSDPTERTRCCSLEETHRVIAPALVSTQAGAPFTSARNDPAVPATNAMRENSPGRDGQPSDPNMPPWASWHNAHHLYAQGRSLSSPPLRQVSAPPGVYRTVPHRGVR